MPSKRPSVAGGLTSLKPTNSPTTNKPTSKAFPSVRPSKLSTVKPSTLKPSSKLSSIKPTSKPSKIPTSRSSRSPSSAPSKTPTNSPSKLTSAIPVKVLTSTPIKPKSTVPTIAPSATSSRSTPPTRKPTAPTTQPTQSISGRPSKSPLTSIPAKSPTSLPSSSSSPFATLPTSPPLGVPTVNQDISYHPNRFIMTGPVNLYNIYWGDFKDPTATVGTMPLIDSLASKIGVSFWYFTVSSYYQIDPATNNKTYASRTVNFPLKSINIDPTLSSKELTESAITNQLVSLINIGRLPADSAGIYMFIFNGNFTMKISQSASWLLDWCSYTNTIFIGDPSNRIPLRYAVMGDPSRGPKNIQQNCEALAPPTANNNLGGDSIANLYAVALASIVTNWNSAWYFDSDPGIDIGSKCLWEFGGGGKNFNQRIGNYNYLLQLLWKPGYGCQLPLK